MHTARSLAVSPSMHFTGGVCSVGEGGGAWSLGVCSLEGAWSQGGLLRGVPCLAGGIPACTEETPSCGHNSWHTLLKILPCPKLRLRAVNIVKYETTPQFCCNIIVCQKAYFKKSELNTHILGHDGTVWKWDFPNWKYEATDKRHLKNHKRSHSKVLQ